MGINLASSAESIKKLISEFKLLTAQQEQRKLEIIEQFELIIKNEVNFTPRTYSPTKLAEIHTPQEALYYLLLSLGLIKNAVGSYLYANTLFALVPDISNPLLVCLSFVYLVVNSILFYAFEISFIKEALNIMDPSTDLSLLIDTFSKQFKTTLVINRLLRDMSMMFVEDATYNQYLELARLINKDLGEKHNKLGAYEESTPKYCLRMAVLAFSGLTSVAESYFLAKSLMTANAASLVVTPVGWGIITLSIVVDLAFNFAMAVSSIMQLVNPDYENYQSLKKELVHFDEKACEDNLVNLHNMKNRFVEKRPFLLELSRSVSYRSNDDESMLGSEQSFKI